MTGAGATMILAEPHADLLTELHALAASGEFSANCLRMRATASHCLKAVDVPGATLILPLLGQKRMRDGARALQCERGQLLLVPGPRRLDMENIPDAATGEYTAVAIALHAETLDLARKLVPERARSGTSEVAKLGLEAVREPLADWCAALRAGWMPRACHALLGLVLHLYAQGHHALLEQAPPRLSARIRGVLAENPARDWRSADIEGHLAMSGASVRRHLAAEGTSLRELLVDVRLARALDLLYTTRLPVKTVASRVGYASASSFVKRFAERYGVEPSQLGQG